MLIGDATARTCANIALAKYWGKSGTRHNVPAVPSISLTLDALVTETRVTLDASLEQDVVWLDGARASERESARVTELLDRLRSDVERTERAVVVSVNHFPTASGLASSASGFAALAAAGAAAYGANHSLGRLSALARRSSASAARSLFGGFVELPAGGPDDAELAASPLAPAEHWDLRFVLALATYERKKTASRDGMLETARTSPLYAGWLAAAPGLCHEIREGVLARDVQRVGEAMEASTYAFHATALAARPAIRYLRPESIVLLDCVTALRARGVGAWATLDAGPHVKVLCEASDAETVRAALEETGVAEEIRVARPGPGVTVSSPTLR